MTDKDTTFIFDVTSLFYDAGHTYQGKLNISALLVELGKQQYNIKTKLAFITKWSPSLEPLIDYLKSRGFKVLFRRTDKICCFDTEIAIATFRACTIDAHDCILIASTSNQSELLVDFAIECGMEAKVINCSNGITKEMMRSATPKSEQRGTGDPCTNRECSEGLHATVG